MDDDLFEPAEEGENCEPLAASLLAVKPVRLMDAHHFEEASACIEEILENRKDMIGLHRSLLMLEHAYLGMIASQDADISEIETKEMKTFMKQMKDYISVIRVMYTAALLKQKDEAEAERELMETAKNRYKERYCSKEE